MATKRNYRKEYDNYHSKPEQIKNRMQRNKARAKIKREVGESRMKGKDVDHIKPIRSGGGNGRKNLRLRSPSKNRSRKQ